MQDDPSAVSGDLCFFYQSGPAGFSAGAAWPSIYQGFGVPVSYSGVIFCIISVGTVLSSLQSDRMTRRFGAGGVTAISVAMTAAALFGFSVSSSFWAMCLWAIPYGLGAGSVDAALNNYVALHFASRHMSWLHCMWGSEPRSGHTSWARRFLPVPGGRRGIGSSV